MNWAGITLARGLSAGWETWRAFWFQPQQMYSLGLVRIAYGALVIVWTLWLLPVRKTLLGPAGISTAQPSIPDTWGLFAVWNSDEAILIGIVVLLVAATGLFAFRREIANMTSYEARASTPAATTAMRYARATRASRSATPRPTAPCASTCAPARRRTR